VRRIRRERFSCLAVAKISFPVLSSSIVVCGGLKSIPSPNQIGAEFSKGRKEATIPSRGGKVRGDSMEERMALSFN